MGNDADENQMKTVRELREERHLTREELAVALKTTFSTIVRIELGKTRPRLDLAERIYKFFDVPVGSIDWSAASIIAVDTSSEVGKKPQPETLENLPAVA